MLKPAAIAPKLIEQPVFPPAAVRISPQDKRELELGLAVDYILSVIKRRLETYFALCTARTSLYAEKVMNGKAKLDDEAFFRHVIARQELAALSDSIMEEIHKGLYDYLGVVTADFSAMYSNYDEMIDWDYLNYTLNEYRKTLLVAGCLIFASNQVWQKSLGKFPGSLLADKLVEQMDLGGISLGMAGCHPVTHMIRYRRQLEKCLAGIVRNMHLRLVNLFCQATARIFYMAYDGWADARKVRAGKLANRTAVKKVKHTLLKAV